MCQTFGDHDLDNIVHDTLLAVVQTIQRGEFHESPHLIGLIRRIARQQASAHLEPIAANRNITPIAHREESSTNSTKVELMVRVLRQLGARDREVLTRFYLHEQSLNEICSEMSLTEAQFRLLISRSRARFGELEKKELHERTIAALASVRNAGEARAAATPALDL